MWATKGNIYSGEKNSRSTSMKWHLLDEDSVEEREVEIGWGVTKRGVIKNFGWLMCGGNKFSWMFYNKYNGKTTDMRFIISIRDSINLTQSNVCYYCKKFRMKQLNIQDRIIG